jgi:hypothetical protein
MPKQTTKSNAKRYEQQWDVPSESDRSTYYTVSLTQEGQLICSCWPFLRNRQPCKHIRQVQSGQIAARGQPVAAPPANVAPVAVHELRLVLANVRCVTPVAEKADAVITSVKVPEIPRGNEHFLLTVLYDLARLGVNWPTLVARYRLSSDLTAEWVENYITEYGRLIYGPLQGGKFEGWEYLPPEGV